MYVHTPQIKNLKLQLKAATADTNGIGAAPPATPGGGAHLHNGASTPGTGSCAQCKHLFDELEDVEQRYALQAPLPLILILILIILPILY